MTIKSDVYDFTADNVNKAPDYHGVYELIQDGVTIYYGRAAGVGVTIRSRLKSHYAGHEGRCTQQATKYRRETMTAIEAERAEQRLLAEYRTAYGRYPRCNDRAA